MNTLKRLKIITHIGTCNKGSFHPSFIHPIFREADQLKLKEEGEFERHTFLPVRPLNVNQNSSVFFDPLVNKVTNHIMREGNKILARTLIEKSFEIMKRVQLRKYNEATTDEERDKIIINPWELLHKAVANSRPFLQTTKVKRGGHTYQVPVPIRETASLAIAINWIIEAGKDKDDDTRFYERFAYEIIDASNGVGKVIKRKQDLHRLCEANRAYAHYRWS